MCLQCLPFLTRFHPSPLSPRLSRLAPSPTPPDTHLPAASASVATGLAASKIPPLEAKPSLQPMDSSSSATYPDASSAIQAFPVQEPESTVKPSYAPQLVSQADDYGLEPSKVPEAPAPHVGPDQIVSPDHIKFPIALTGTPALSLQQDQSEFSNESSYYSTLATEYPAEQPTGQDRPELSDETSSESDTSPQECSDNALSLPNENVDDESVTQGKPASDQAEKYALYVKFPHPNLKLVRPGKGAKQKEHQHHHRITKQLHEIRKQVKEEGQRQLQNFFTGTKYQAP